MLTIGRRNFFKCLAGAIGGVAAAVYCPALVGVALDDLPKDEWVDYGEVYDRGTGQVRFYINGKLVSESPSEYTSAPPTFTMVSL